MKWIIVLFAVARASQGDAGPGGKIAPPPHQYQYPSFYEFYAPQHQNSDYEHYDNNDNQYWPDAQGPPMVDHFGPRENVEEHKEQIRSNLNHLKKSQHPNPLVEADEEPKIKKLPETEIKQVVLTTEASVKSTTPESKKSEAPKIHDNFPATIKAALLIIAQKQREAFMEKPVEHTEQKNFNYPMYPAPMYAPPPTQNSNSNFPPRPIQHGKPGPYPHPVYAPPPQYSNFQPQAYPDYQYQPYHDYYRQYRNTQDGPYPQYENEFRERNFEGYNQQYPHYFQGERAPPPAHAPDMGAPPHFENEFGENSHPNFEGPPEGHEEGPLNAPEEHDGPHHPSESEEHPHSFRDQPIESSEHDDHHEQEGPQAPHWEAGAGPDASHEEEGPHHEEGPSDSQEEHHQEHHGPESSEGPHDGDEPHHGEVGEHQKHQERHPADYEDFIDNMIHRLLGSWYPRESENYSMEHEREEHEHGGEHEPDLEHELDYPEHGYGPEQQYHGREERSRDYPENNEINEEYPPYPMEAQPHRAPPPNFYPHPFGPPMFF